MRRNSLVIATSWSLIWGFVGILLRVNGIFYRIFLRILHTFNSIESSNRWNNRMNMESLLWQWILIFYFNWEISSFVIYRSLSRLFWRNMRIWSPNKVLGNDVVILWWRSRSTVLCLTLNCRLNLCSFSISLTICGWLNSRR